MTGAAPASAPGAPPEFGPRKPKRADARRNYEAVVAAAQRAFLRDGAGTSIDEIARAAGVGSATLYRHFPNRDDLLVAALAENMAATHRRGTELVSAPRPAEALRAWLLAMIDQVSTYGDLPGRVLDAAGSRNSALGVTCASMQEITRTLLDRAREAGAVRADVTPEELFDLVSGIAWTVSRNRPEDGGRRLLDLTLGGLAG
ncbi:TetR/AcrR family transcriptional regulator [Actinomadura rugatobispora]|uniref:TetR/AcrR family transcriptional regulator n=1 Tax=Actinomadura rugatobispora TaxID=1994 RepID=A0ABW0ZVP6_9ACTN|nr:TetR/AcrR family transcriptional regulator [Actinomadura rugatobispora]